MKRTRRTLGRTKYGPPLAAVVPPKGEHVGIRLVEVDGRTLEGRKFWAVYGSILDDLGGPGQVPKEPLSEAWLICGRRSGKSFILALVAVFLALFKDWSGVLKPGERGTILIIASDRKQGRVIMGYIKGLISGVPALAPKVVNDKEELLSLDNGISIEIHTASFRSVRGYTIVAALCDEIAFWKSDDSANPDKEILDALRPGMATTLAHGALLLCASSPYARGVPSHP